MRCSRQPGAGIPSPRRRYGCLALIAAFAAPLAASGGARSQESRPLEIGVLPNVSARVLLEQYQPMRAYLGRELGRPVQVSTAPSWSAFHQRTLALEYDLVVTGAHLARIAQLDRGYTPLLGYLPDMRALLVVAASRPLRDINELRGRALVLANPQSLVAMRGLQWLAELGLRRDRDFDVIETPTDDSVGNVVVRGDAAAAMLSAGELRAVPEATRAQLVVLASFAEVPGFVVLASPRLAPETARWLRELLLHFARESEEGKSFFASTGLTAIREIPPGLMESLDPYVEPTRKAFAPV